MHYIIMGKVPRRTPGILFCAQAGDVISPLADQVPASSPINVVHHHLRIFVCITQFTVDDLYANVTAVNVYYRKTRRLARMAFEDES